MGDDAGVTFASLNIEELASQDLPSLDTVFRPPAPFTPFDCTGVDIIAPDLESK